MVPGLLLGAISVLFVFGLVRTLLLNQQLMFQAIVAGLMLAFAWYLYMQLPHFLRRLISKLFKRSHTNDHGHH